MLAWRIVERRRDHDEGRAVSKTTAILCHGDDRVSGCGEVIAMLNQGSVIRAGGGEILSYDRQGRARIACRCGAITMTRGQMVQVQTALT